MNAYENKKVLVTGHLGFKGRWLVERLRRLSAVVYGFDLPTHDIRNPAVVYTFIRHHRFDFIFHLAAQAFVPVGFEEPLETIMTNVIGTANVLDALRYVDCPCAVVIVTTDKVYGERSVLHHASANELSDLIGRCPYSASKVAVEHLVEAYRSSFFAPDHRIAVATARAGNVIGGGDFGRGRLIPNAVKALREGRPIPVYNSQAVRPWQYIEDVIEGYLKLGSALSSEDRLDRLGFIGAWNFGPDQHHTVRDVVEEVIAAWGIGTWEIVPTSLVHEVDELRIDSTKAHRYLGWAPRWNFRDAIRQTIRWYREHPEAK